MILKNKFNIAVIAIFMASIIYWVYLIFASKMAILCDAKSYYDLGELIYKDGWRQYFVTGPNREPLFPFSIYLSMKLGGIFSVPYFYIQKVFHVLILVFTQLSVFYFLRKMQINKTIILLAVSYIGFSPAIVNSAFCLFSEIFVFPFIIGIVGVSVLVWRNIGKFLRVGVIYYAILFSVLFLLATAVKGIFYYVFFIFIAVYLLRAIFSFKNKAVSFRLHLFVLSALFIFNIFFVSYKWFNFKYNGKYEFTDRVGELLYGNAVKRSQKLTTRIFLAHIASIPGQGLVERFFTPEEAHYCGFQGADGCRIYAKGLSDSERIDRTVKILLQHPFQYCMFMSIESLRMFFWETTKLGFVSYPSWLNTIFDFNIFKNSLRFVISLLTIISFVWALIFIFIRREMLYDNQARESLNIGVLFFINLLISSYTFFYSFFSVVTRYSVVLAPFFIINISCFLDMLIKKRGIR